MANIYNTFTKKTQTNVIWAPKGKYWYVTGRKQKYYPKNGWKKSTSSGGYKKTYTKRRYSRKY